MVMLQVYTPILPACVPSNCIWHWFHNLQNVCLQKWQSKKKKSPFSSSLYAFKFSLKRNTERGRLHLKNLVFYFFVRCCCCFLFFFHFNVRLPSEQSPNCCPKVMPPPCVSGTDRKSQSSLILLGFTAFAVFHVSKCPFSSSGEHIKHPSPHWQIVYCNAKWMTESLDHFDNTMPNCKRYSMTK